MLGNSAPKNPKNWKHSSLPHIFWWVTQEKKQTCRFILVSTELCIWGSYNIALHCNNFHNKLQKNLGKCDQYHETNASVRSTVGICFHVEYTKRAWLHLLQSHSRDISFRLFQFKHQLLSQSDFSPTDPPIHFHKLNLPNSFDLHENTLTYICTVQPSAGRNHFSSRMRLPSSLLIWLHPMEYLVSLAEHSFHSAIQVLPSPELCRVNFPLTITEEH